MNKYQTELAKLNEIAETISKQGDLYFWIKDANRLYPAFGLEKIRKQNSLRYVHDAEFHQQMAQAAQQMAKLERTCKEKTGDWAIMGGIAQGIGGLGAGISAAAQTQLNNLEIRERNAKREENARQLERMSQQFLNADPGKDSLRINSDCIQLMKINTRCSTQELFEHLSMTCDLSKGKAEKPNIPDTFEYTDSDGRTRMCRVYFTSDMETRIDGYVRMIMNNDEGLPVFEKIIPLPLMGIGTGSNSFTCVKIPNFVGSLSWQPVALWEITGPSCEGSVGAESLKDLNDSRLEEEWRVNELQSFDADRKYRDELKRIESDKSRGRAKKVFKWIAIIAACMVVICLAATGIQILQERNLFSDGCKQLESDPQKADAACFSQLPISYHRQIADAYLGLIDETDTGKEQDLTYTAQILDLASKYAVSEQNERICRLRAQMDLSKGDYEQFYDDVKSGFNRRYMDADEVLDYAKQVKTADPDEANRAALLLLGLIRKNNAEAESLYQEWDTHAKAIRALENREYQEAFAYFEKNTKHVSELRYEEKEKYLKLYPEEKWDEDYLALCRGAATMFGKWGDDEGNVLEISYDPKKAPEYLRIEFKDERDSYKVPYKIYVNMIWNGNDISYYYDSPWGGVCQSALKSDDGTRLTYSGIDTYHALPYNVYYQEEDDTIRFRHESAKKGKKEIEYTFYWEKILKRTE